MNSLLKNAFPEHFAKPKVESRKKQGIKRARFSDGPNTNVNWNPFGDESDTEMETVCNTPSTRSSTSTNSNRSSAVNSDTEDSDDDDKNDEDYNVEEGGEDEDYEAEDISATSLSSTTTKKVTRKNILTKTAKQNKKNNSRKLGNLNKDNDIDNFEYLTEVLEQAGLDANDLIGINVEYKDLEAELNNTQLKISEIRGDAINNAKALREETDSEEKGAILTEQLLNQTLSVLDRLRDNFSESGQLVETKTTTTRFAEEVD